MPERAASEDSIWFPTRSALFRGGDEAWAAVACYEVPLRRLLGRRYARLQDQDREDLVQEILIEMKETLAARHDPARGRFRALLQTVVARRVTDRLRRRRAVPLPDGAPDEVEAPPAEEIEELDLEAALVRAVALARDRFTQGPERDADVLYALCDRIVHGRSNKEIAGASGGSADRVARLLERGRDAILSAFLAGELGLAGDDSRAATALAALKESLRRPGETARILEDLRDRALREPLEGFLERLRAAFGRLAGDGTARGEELRRGLALVLAPDPAEAAR